MISKKIKLADHEHNTSDKMHFDLILIDPHMPVMDGLEVVSRLRAMEKSDAFGLGVDLHHVQRQPCFFLFLIM
jgi:CheY-like chemotaxis protein